MSILAGDHPEFRASLPKQTSPRRGLSLIEILVVLSIIVLLIALLSPAIRTGSGEAPRRSQCVNNLKQIMLALHNYADAHGALPPAYTVDANSRPLHSWRTLILPYLEQDDLYKTIDLSKPWNDPANAKAFETPINVYECPSVGFRAARSNKTVYRASIGPHAFLRPTEPRPLATITDGTASTIAVSEVGKDDAVPWMAPEDADEAMILKLGPDSHLQHIGGVNTAFADGFVRFLKATTTPEVRRALITVDGGETVSTDQY